MLILPVQLSRPTPSPSSLSARGLKLWKRGAFPVQRRRGQKFTKGDGGGVERPNLQAVDGVADWGLEVLAWGCQKSLRATP